MAQTADWSMSMLVLVEQRSEGLSEERKKPGEEEKVEVTLGSSI